MAGPHLDLVGVEVEVAPLPLEHLAGGIVVERDSDVVGAVNVMKDAGDGGVKTGEEEVVGVGPPGLVGAAAVASVGASSPEQAARSTRPAVASSAARLR